MRELFEDVECLLVLLTALETKEYESALLPTHGFVVEIEVRTSLSPTQDSARFTRMLSCAHRLAAVTSFNARSLRFCCRWI